MYKQGQSACPVACRYCVITEVESRRAMWNSRTLVGMNKSVTILNPPPDRTDRAAVAAFYSFPVELLTGDFVGFNAISDPFWPKYALELGWFLRTVSPVARLVTCVTKFSVKRQMMERLAEIPNFRLIVSITGLDQIERTTTASRLATLAMARQCGVKAFPVIHPYIVGMSDLSFLPRLVELGYDAVDVKGLRYDAAMAAWLPEQSRRFYLGDDETLPDDPDDGWRETVARAGLRLQSLRHWYLSDYPATPAVDLVEAQATVRILERLANITSSDSDEAVIEAAVRRRLINAI